MIKSLRLSYLRSMHVEVNMEKVAITGVLQLLGFHLCNQCLNQGIEVVGFDNFEQKQTFENRNASCDRPECKFSIC